MNDFSIDLETLGLRYDAPIISIGVVQFDRLTGKTGAEFYRVIDLDSALRAGRASGSVLAWWMTQSPAAKGVFSEKDGVSLATALDEMSRWMRSFNVTPVVWGNGATFDITILEHAYANAGVGLAMPWHFTNVRDMRTIVDAAQFTDVQYMDLKKSLSEGTHHNALDDAKFQARMISAAWQRIHRAVNTKGGEFQDPKPKDLSKKAPAPAPAVEEDEL